MVSENHALIRKVLNEAPKYSRLPNRDILPNKLRFVEIGGKKLNIGLFFVYYVKKV